MSSFRGSRLPAPPSLDPVFIDNYLKDQGVDPDLRRNVVEQVCRVVLAAWLGREETSRTHPWGRFFCFSEGPMCILSCLIFVGKNVVGEQ